MNKPFANLAPRDKRIVILGSIVIASAILVRFVAAPGWDRWQDARAVVDQYQNQLAHVEQQLTRRDSAFNRLRERFGPAADAPLLGIDATRVAFPKSVQEALKKCPFKIERLELQDIRRLRKNRGLAVVSLRVEGICEGNAISNLLAALREAEQLILIDRYELSMVTSGNRSKWRVQLTLSTPAKTKVGS